MCSAEEYWVASFLAIVALWDPRVHVGASDGSNVAAEVEGVVNEKFSFEPILWVPYI